MIISICRALLNFMRYGDQTLLAFANVILTAMSGNANYPTAAALVLTLGTAYKDYALALSKCSTGDRQCIAAKDMRKEELLAVLRELNELVNTAEDTSREVMATSGFDLSKDASTPKHLVPASSIKLIFVTSGELKMVLKGVKNKTGLTYQYAVDGSVNPVTGEPVWISFPCNKLTYTFTNLPVGSWVLIRVAITGSRNQVIYTEPISKMVA